MVLAHRRELILANIVAILATAAAVPVPLLIPLLVDEVLLDHPGAAVAFLDRVSPSEFLARSAGSGWRCCALQTPYFWRSLTAPVCCIASKRKRNRLLQFCFRYAALA